MRCKRTGKAKGPKMIGEIIRLREAGLSVRAISRALNCSRNTVDKYLAAGPAATHGLAPIGGPWCFQNLVGKVSIATFSNTTGADKFQ
ncbi:MAG: helix-turn-helix domain-containing protein [Proteobacteria bacterium]|nr:helix-turn-helix domain-containing protein [Pseudomonadota bacterium]